MQSQYKLSNSTQVKFQNRQNLSPMIEMETVVQPLIAKGLKENFGVVECTLS